MAINWTQIFAIASIAVVSMVMMMMAATSQTTTTTKTTIRSICVQRCTPPVHNRAESRTSIDGGNFVGMECKRDNGRLDARGSAYVTIVVQRH